MKRLLFLMVICAVALSLALPTLADNTSSKAFIIDQAGILSEHEINELNERANEIVAKYPCEVAIYIVDDYCEYTESSIEDFCEELYQSFGLGYGNGKDAIILLLSMEERDYALRDFGDYTKDNITEYGFDLIEESFKNDFSDDEWYDGLSAYFAQCEEILEAAKNGEPLDEPELTLTEKIVFGYGVALVIGIISAWITCSVFKAKMKTAVKATSADRYVAPGGVELRVREDRYTHTTKSKRKIETDSNRSSDGGNHSRSGKF